MATIILSGGFHNSSDITIRVSNSLYRMYAMGRIEFDNILSDYQRKRLEQHFCGVKGCKCGSYKGANIEVY